MAQRRPSLSWAKNPSPPPRFSPKTYRHNTAKRILTTTTPYRTSPRTSKATISPGVKLDPSQIVDYRFKRQPNRGGMRENMASIYRETWNKRIDYAIRHSQMRKIPTRRRSGGHQR